MQLHTHGCIAVLHDADDLRPVLLCLQEVKLGDKQRIEALFERATHMQLPPKKMKFLFKRYLQYEQEHGDAAAVAHVKKQALDFVQQHMAS